MFESSEHTVSIAWKNSDDSMPYETYPRAHSWRFDDGTPSIRASAAAGYNGDADALDPEQALVGALASCHMLTVLAIASKKRWVVLSYADEAVGTLAQDEEGRMAVTEVVLRPTIELSGENIPDAAALEKLHQSAHRNCFIANSVKTKVRIESPL